MTPSPTTPQHSRNSSAVDSLHNYSHARRQSRSSINDPATPFSNDPSHQDSIDLGVLASGGAPGMGNLADELADAFSDSNDDEDGEYGDQENTSQSRNAGTQGATADGIGDKGAGYNSTPTKDIASGNENSSGLLSPHGRGHQRKISEYDGSEYGSESDLDAAGMPPTLIAKIDAIESLTRRGTEKYGGPGDEVFQRVTDGLRDLGPQSTVEGNASR
ncbi:hypothetical protein MAC_06444 [Metarhizium acridum CQMa 102]|uniref:Uncharacterized protein n=2 Tax=Metarhizium acridum TaxID=92637 RepID=E9E996_METAQ|nr:uncharacterized protein MAC_06444 [Metarhizium acridum CQMa 102]EFY87467.1 hypothetical protein MAC_06444 [Metarhizium acridum CQMa 102]